MSDEFINVNVFDQDNGRNYKDLEDVIDFEGFNYHPSSYQKEEVELLQPQLEALGYTEIRWLPGETDSFGPLTRVYRAFDKDGELHWFIYG